MTVKTVYTCDICGMETGRGTINLTLTSDYDVCDFCIKAIARRAISLKLLILRPWCSTCSGKGHTKEITHYDACGRNEYENIECSKCKL